MKQYPHATSRTYRGIAGGSFTIDGNNIHGDMEGLHYDCTFNDLADVMYNKCDDGTFAVGLLTNAPGDVPHVVYFDDEQMAFELCSLLKRGPNPLEVHQQKKRGWFFGFAALFAIVVIGALLFGGNDDYEESTSMPYSAAEEALEPTEEPAHAQDNNNSILHEGLYFELSDIFIVEIITELTQYHLDEEQRETVYYFIDYHMGEAVLFVPMTITTMETRPQAYTSAGEPIGSPYYRFRPGIRARTHTGRLSVFEADTLNGRRFFSSPFGTFDEVPNYEGSVIEGYLAFIWEGYGEYRLEILSDGGIVEELVILVDEDNAISAVVEIETPEPSQDERLGSEANSYREFMAEIMASLAEHSFSLASQNQLAGENVAYLIDQDWIVQTAVIVTFIRLYATSILEFDISSVPHEYEDAHNYFIIMANHLLDAMDYYVYGIDNLDVASINRSAELQTLAASYATRASDLM